MNNPATRVTNTQKHKAAQLRLLGVLQPADSKRVANAIIATLQKEADGLGIDIIRTIKGSIEGCLGSYELGEIIRGAIEAGISNRDQDWKKDIQ